MAITDFSYNKDKLGNGAVTTANRNGIRLLIADTNSTDRLFSDDEIEFFATQEANIYGAASLAATQLQFRFASEADKTVGDLSIKSSQKSVAYEKLAKMYLTKSKDKGSPQIWLGGATISGKNTDRSNDDLVQPAFLREIFDFPKSNTNSTLAES